MSTETLYPDNSVLSSSNLTSISVNTGTGAITCTVSSNNVDTQLRLSMPSPSGTLTGTQTLNATWDKFGGTGTPTAYVAAYENGALVATGTTVNVTGAGISGSVSFDASALADASGVDVQIEIYSTKSGGAGPARAVGRPVSATWDVNYTVSARTGVLTQTLGDATLSAAGVLPVVGTLAQTLENATLSAGGAVAVVGALTQTLEDASLAATGETVVAEREGVLSVVLEDATLTAAGVLPIYGVLSQTLEDASLTAAGVLPIYGLLSQTLEDVTLVGRGETLESSGPVRARRHMGPLMRSFLE